MISPNPMPVTPPEQTLFAALTRLLQEMHASPLGQVEAAIEERFRSFLRTNATATGPRAGSLEITLTWGLPEGPDSWAFYSAAYRTIDGSCLDARDGNIDETVDNVVPFPDLEQLRAIAGVA